MPMAGEHRGSLGGVTDSDFPTPNASIDLTGQIALVTGASSGLGRRFAITLAAAGAQVVAAARRVERLDDLAAEIAAAGGSCLPVPLDITDADQIVRAVDLAESEVGTITILVNNAGIPDAQRAHKMSLELVDAVLDTNVRGPWLLACEVAKRLIAAERPGRIVNISSMGAFSYNGMGAALYSVSKAAVNRMTEALAVEWARFGINVNAHRAGRFLVRDDGRHAVAHRRHHQGLPASPAREPRSARQHVAVPRVACVRVRHRHRGEGGRRPGRPLRPRCRDWAAGPDRERGCVDTPIGYNIGCRELG